MCPAAYKRGAGNPLIEAHSGDSSNAPENTLAAFKRALALGVSSIELDVRPARCGTVMVMHDATVDRTTDGSGKVCEMTLAELLGLDAGAWFGTAFAGERIPRLIDVLEIVAPTRTRLNIEIKSSPPGTDVPQAVAGFLRRFGKHREYFVSSFDISSLLQVRLADPGIPLALIGDGPGSMAQALRHDIPWINCRHRTVDRAFIAHAHRRGIRVSVWTVDDSGTLPFWRIMGVDKICTNRPALMLRAGRSDRGMPDSRSRQRRRYGFTGRPGFTGRHGFICDTVSTADFSLPALFPGIVFYRFFPIAHPLTGRTLMRKVSGTSPLF